MNRVQVSGGAIAYVDQGVGPKTVLLLHGFPTSSVLWRGQIPLLASRIRVIAPDLLGYGGSDMPAAADLSVSAQAGYVRELLEQLGVEDVAVVGHGVGGAVAQLLALEGGVRTMVLLDSACFDAWPDDDLRAIQGVDIPQQTAERAEGVVRELLRRGIGHGERVDEPTIQRYVEPWLDDPRALFRAAAAIDGRGLVGRESELAALDIPVLVIWGEEDPWLPPALAERLGDVLPGATVALLPGCSHFVTEDAGPTVEQLTYEYLRLRHLEESHSHATGGPVMVYLQRPPPDAGLEDE